MFEIYWLTRVGVIGNVCQVIAIICLIIVGIYMIFYPMFLDLSDNKQAFKSWVKKSAFVILPIWFISLLGLIFVPTQKEMLLIYGLGTTVDYIKSNDKAKELPDKAVDALTRYIDTISKEDKED
jgi:hypothetical protein